MGEKTHEAPGGRHRSGARPGSHVSRGSIRWSAALEPLRLLLFLACVTLVLEHFHAFKRLDAYALTIVGQMSPPPDTQKPGELGDVVAVSASTRMFESDVFGFKLPVDRDGLAKMLATLAPPMTNHGGSPDTTERPAVIAIDVDITPLLAPPAVAAEAASAASAPPPPQIHQAILAALDAGVDVVASTYPSERTDQTKEWRRRLCDAVTRAAGEAALQHRVFGRLRIATPDLAPSTMHRIVVDYQRAPVPLIGAFSMTEAPLGVAAAELKRTRPLKPATHAEPMPCGEVAVAVKHEGVDHHGDNEHFINFFSGRTSTMEVHSLEELAMWRPLLNNKVVVLAVKSFTGVDEHLTPFGAMAGSAVHAAIAQTDYQQAFDTNHLFAFLIDLALGLAFLALSVGLHWIIHRLAHHLGPGSPLLYLTRLLGPLMVFGTVGWFALLMAQRMAYQGLWMNPLVLLIGLTLHMYEHLAAAGGEPDGTLHARRAFVDRVLSGIGYALLAGSVIWAAHILTCA